jgi:hypothetical protein
MKMKGRHDPTSLPATKFFRTEYNYLATIPPLFLAKNSISNAFRFTFRQMDNNFAEFLTTGGRNTPTHFLERRLILSVVKVLCTLYTHSLYPHCTHKVLNAKGKGCTCTRCTCGSGIPVSSYAFFTHATEKFKSFILVQITLTNTH